MSPESVRSSAVFEKSLAVRVTLSNTPPPRPRPAPLSPAPTSLPLRPHQRTPGKNKHALLSAPSSETREKNTPRQKKPRARGTQERNALKEQRKEEKRGERERRMSCCCVDSFFFLPVFLPLPPFFPSFRLFSALGRILSLPHLPQWPRACEGLFVT